MSFSGGVSEYIYGGEAKPLAISARSSPPSCARGSTTMLPLARPDARIRATVIGASQYTHASVRQHDLRLAARNAAAAQRAGDRAGIAARRRQIDPAAVAAAIKSALKRLDLGGGESPVALFVPWRGSATFQRLDDFCRGMADGLAAMLAHGHPIVLAGDGDVGGLIGIHFCEEMKLKNPIVSIDGLELKDFDYIDIGAILDTSGAVPVVIKSLVFPTSTSVGEDRQSAPAVADMRR